MTQQGFRDFAYKNSVIEVFLLQKVTLIIIWLLTL